MQRSIFILAIIFFCSMWFSISGQSFQDLVLKKSGRNLESVMDSFEQSIQVFDDESKRKKQKHFYRLMKAYEGKLDQNGNVINYMAMNMKAFNQAKKEFPSFSKDDSRSTHGQWENISPSSFNKREPSMGRSIRLAAHPTSPTTLFVGAPHGGLWKSTNSGASWTNLMPGFISLGISGIAIHPTNPDIMYILSGDGDGLYSTSTGIYKTTNGGQDWEPTGLTFNENEIIRGVQLRMHPDFPYTMLAATSRGIYKTTNGWISHEIVPDTVFCVDLEIAPQTTDTIYASHWDGRFYRSTDRGSNFSLMFQSSEPDTTLPSRTEIAIAPNAPGVVYFLMAWNADPGGASGGYYELYKSTDFGSSFNLVSNGTGMLGEQVSVDLTMEVNPTDENQIFIGGVPLMRSDDGGLTFTNIIQGQNNVYCHVDIHDIMFHGGQMYVAAHGGVSRTTDYGENWVNASNGLKIMLYTDIDVFDNQFIGGTQDNGTQKWTIGSESGVSQIWGDGFECQFDRSGSGIIYASTQNNRYIFNPNETRITPNNHTSNWDAAWAFHPTNTDTSYCFLKDMRRTYDKGATWDSLFIGLPEQENIRTVSQCQNFPNFMYVSDRKDIAFTTNIHSANPTWQLVTDSIPESTGNGWFHTQIGSVSVDPESPYRVYVTMFGYDENHKVFMSSNAGINDSWINITDNLPNIPIRASIAAPGLNNGIYVGTDIGVFYRDDSHDEWIWFGNAMPKVSIQDMVISDGYLYVGTYGRGAWRSPLYSTCPTTILLNENTVPDPTGIAGIQQFSANSSVLSNRTIYGGPGTNVKFSSGLSVILYDGFTVKPNTTFEATLDGCPE